MHDEWRPVIGFEGAYEVSAQGNVRSVARTVIRSNGRPARIQSRARALKTTPKGYREVTLVLEGRLSTRLVHHLVAEAFHGSRPTPTHVIRHLNGMPGDNRATNLAWGTASENQMDAVAHGTHGTASRTHCPRGHPLTAPNLAGNKYGRRVCLACKREYDAALFEARPFDASRADARYADVLAGRRRHKSEQRF